MIEGPIEALLEWFENLLIKQQRIANLLLTSTANIPLELSLDILRMNIATLETISEVIDVMHELDDYMKESTWEMCREAISWVNLILASADKSECIFLQHLNVKGKPLFSMLENLAQDIYKDYQSVELTSLQRSIKDVVSILKQQMKLNSKLSSQIL